MVRHLPPFESARLEDLPAYLTLDQVAELAGVSPKAARHYPVRYSEFPARAFTGKTIRATADVLEWLERKPRLLRQRGPEALVDEHGRLLPGVQVPEFSSVAEIASLLDVPKQSIVNAAYYNKDFPPRAFGAATVVFPAAGVLVFLRRLRDGAWPRKGLEALDAEADLLTYADIATVLEVSEASVQTFRYQRDSDVFPAPALDPDRGRPYRPARFARGDVVDYVRSYRARRLEAGWPVPSNVEAFLEASER